MTSNKEKNNVWLYKLNSDLEKCIIDHFVSTGRWNKVIWHDAEFEKIRYQDYEMKKRYDEHKSVHIPDEIYDIVYKYLFMYIDMYIRWSPWSSSIYDQKNIHDYLNLFNRSVNFIYFLLQKEKIDLVIFNRAPHLGGDFLLYLLAKELNIKTLLLEQSKFPNKFFQYTDFFDFGSFETSKRVADFNPVKLERKFEKKLWYMDDIYKKNKRSPRRILTDLIRDEYRLLVESFGHKGWTQSLYRYSLRKEFKKNSKSIESGEVDFDKSYIYFPLHLQPEQTTSAWGGKYTDQLLALERLSDKLPDGWQIYVKENPGQNFYMRGEHFYERLKAIPYVKVVPGSVDTYHLLEHCKFSATITGTVGWEAITGGKSVLVFGWGVWYKSLPGVFEYNESIDLEEIADYKIDHEELEHEVAMLQTKMCEGIVYLQERKGYKDFDDKVNKKTVIGSLEKILYEPAFVE